MNKLFRLRNKANSLEWVSAETIEEAKEIAVDHKRARNVSNLKEVRPPSGYDEWIKFFEDKGDDTSELYTKKGTAAVMLGNGQSKWIVFNRNIDN